jgi:hypothetical protein
MENVMCKSDVFEVVWEPIHSSFFTVARGITKHSFRRHFHKLVERKNNISSTFPMLHDMIGNQGFVFHAHEQKQATSLLL